jgi:DNA-binding Lrp family transcriptional regulator
MTLAFVLLNVETGKESKVVKELEGISEVKETFQVYGVYDVVVRTEADNMNELRDVIGSKIRSISGVRSTLTMIATQ